MSVGFDKPPDAPSNTVEPSIEATMHSATQGRSDESPRGCAVRVGDRDVLDGARMEATHAAIMVVVHLSSTPCPVARCRIFTWLSLFLPTAFIS